MSKQRYGFNLYDLVTWMRVHPSAYMALIHPKLTTETVALPGDAFANDLLLLKPETTGDEFAVLCDLLQQGLNNQTGYRVLRAYEGHGRQWKGKLLLKGVSE